MGHCEIIRYEILHKDWADTMSAPTVRVRIRGPLLSAYKRDRHAVSDEMPVDRINISFNMVDTMN